MVESVDFFVPFTTSLAQHFISQPVVSRFSLEPVFLTYFVFASIMNRMRQDALLKKVLIVVLSVVGAVLIGVLIFNFVLMPWFVKRGKEVEVPEVVGKTFQEAEKILSESKLSYHVQSQIYDPLIPEGFIARQIPAPGIRVKEWKRVYLVISSGPQLVKVPDLIGVRVEQAERLVNLAGLKVGQVLWIHSDTIPQGDVIASHPTSGEELGLGRQIDLIVSKGLEKARFPMPSLLGLSIGEAEMLMEAKALVLGEVKTIDTEGIEEDVVLLQGPQPGELVEEGDTVELGISSPSERP
jgi:serine/threonine-protein kinase